MKQREGGPPTSKTTGYETDASFPSRLGERADAGGGAVRNAKTPRLDKTNVDFLNVNPSPKNLPERAAAIPAEAAVSPELEAHAEAVDDEAAEQRVRELQGPLGGIASVFVPDESGLQERYISEDATTVRRDVPRRSSETIDELLENIVHTEPRPKNERRRRTREEPSRPLVPMGNRLTDQGPSTPGPGDTVPPERRPAPRTVTGAIMAVVLPRPVSSTLIGVGLLGALIGGAYLVARTTNVTPSAPNSARLASSAPVMVTSSMPAPAAASNGDAPNPETPPLSDSSAGLAGTPVTSRPPSQPQAPSAPETGKVPSRGKAPKRPAKDTLDTEPIQATDPMARGSRDLLNGH